MREIKFRAWDVKEKCWIPEDFFAVLSDGKIMTYQNEEARWIEETIEIILMQFTGLKDKNGVEIYEGDIAQVFNNRHVVKYGIARRSMASGWEVDIPCFYFDLLTAEFKAFPIVNNIKGSHDLENMEIIGNIHENPELLKP